MTMRMILYLFLGAMLFAGAATGSMLLARSQMQEQPVQDEPTAPQPEEQLVRRPLGETRRNPLDYPSGPPNSEPRAAELPISVRTAQISASEAFRLAESVRSEREALDKRWEAVEQREARIQLLYGDLQGQQREFEGLLKQIQDSMDALAEIERGVQEQRVKLEEQQREIDQKQKQLTSAEAKHSVGEAENAKTIAKWISEMEPESAAEQLKQLVDDGKMELAIQILSHLQEKQISKIFDAMPEKELVAVFIENYHRNNTPQPRQARRR